MSDPCNNIYKTLQTSFCQNIKKCIKVSSKRAAKSTFWISFSKVSELIASRKDLKMIAAVKVLAILVVGCALQVLGKTPESPCPKIFTYKKEGSLWVGKIVLDKNLQDLKKVDIDIELSLLNHLKDGQVI